LLDKNTATLLPSTPLVVGNAASANAFDMMRKLGITCVLNVTTDIPEPHQSEMGKEIEWHRISLDDAEDQDLSDALDEGLSIIDRIVATGGKVLVHCHEGRSRSVSMCLAYFVTRERMPLAEALNFIKSHRPEAQPNAGFLKQLMALELSTLGSSSLNQKDLPKSKPKCLTCEICGQSVGLKSALASHMKLKHATDFATLSTLGVRAVIENELTALLQRANPSKAQNIPHLLDKYAGREQELYAQVTAKYAGLLR
jgi:atypical dual specificity phosphatase